MAKLDRDLAVLALDPALRILHTQPAKADTYPVGSIVMYDETAKLVCHVDGALTGVVVGRVMVAQTVESGGTLDFESGMHVIPVTGTVLPNEVIYFVDSEGGQVSPTSAIAGGYSRGPISGFGTGVYMVELGTAPKPAGSGD